MNGIETTMPTAISAGKAVSAVASHSTGRPSRPRLASVALSIPNWPLRVQRQTMALMVSETAQGSMMITRARPRPIKSSLRMRAIGTESRTVPPTTATVQTSVRHRQGRKSGSARSLLKLARPAKSLTWPKRLTLCSEVWATS